MLNLHIYLDLINISNRFNNTFYKYYKMSYKLCQYKDLLGKPNQGAHAYRIFNIAIVDLLLTILASLILSKWLKINFLICLICLIILSIIIHTIFCVKTTINVLLGLS